MEGWCRVLVMAVLVSSLAGLAHSSAKSLQAGNSYVTTGLSPAAVAVGNLNGDGVPYIVVAGTPTGSSTGTITACKWEGNTCAATTVIAARSDPSSVLSSVVLSNFNGDGKLDLAYTDSALGTVTVQMNAGNSTFGSAHSAAAGAGATGLIASDIDKDGRAELLVANKSAGTISILSVNSDGSLVSRGQISAGVAAPTAIAVADLDGNGTIDLAVAGWNNEFSVIRGNGDGTFQLAIRYSLPLTPNPRSVAVDDVNADGIPDLVMATGEVAVLLGRGDMSFQPASLYTVPGGAEKVALSDLNSDGRPDIAVTGFTSDSVAILLNNGAGVFLPPQTYAAGSSMPSALAFTDFNSDGQPDLVVTTAFAHSAPEQVSGQTVMVTNGAIAVLYGNGDGSLYSGITTYLGDNSVATALGMARLDFSGSGLPELAVLDAGNRVKLLKNDGDYRYSVLSTINLDFVADAIEAGDVTGDSVPDLIVAGGTRCVILPGHSDGSFDAPISIPIPPTSDFSHHLALADFNGDGRLDIVISNVDATVSDIAVYLNQGNNLFTQKIIAVGERPAGLVTGDFNGDSFLDIAVANGKGFAIVPGKGNGSFDTAVPYNTIRQSDSVAAADLNGDGRLDIVIPASAAGSNGLLQTFLAASDGTFRAGPGTIGASPSGPFLLADLNKDGAPDLVSVSDNLVKIFRNDGTGQFFPAATVAGGYSIRGVLAADVTGSGSLDIVLVGSNDVVTVLPNTGGTHVEVTAAPNPVAYGQTLTLSANVNAPLAYLPAPTGTVTFAEAGSQLAVENLPDAFYASTSLLPGQHTINVEYSGDTSFYARALPSMVVSVQKASTTTTATVNASTITEGAPLAVSISVSPQYAGIPSGSVTLREGSTALATKSLDSQSAANLTTTLPPGEHILTVAYDGDPNFTNSSSAPLAITVQRLTTTAISSRASSVELGDSLTLQASVTATGAVPTGSVSFGDVHNILGEANLDAQGRASITTSSLPVGTHSITAAYAGATTFKESTSAPATVTVNRISAGLTLNASATSVGAGYPLTLTATLSAKSGFAPSGEVVFSSGQTRLGSGALNTSGVASFTTKELAAGTHSIVAAYAGDSSYLQSVSSSVGVTVTPDFVLSSNTPSVTLVAGQSTSIPLSLNGFGGFAGPLTFRCSGLPAGASCTFTPSTVTLSANGSASVTVTISTAATTTAQGGRTTAPTLFGVFATSSFSVFGIVLLRKGRRSRTMLSCVLIAFTSLALLSGCGGGSNQPPQTTRTIPGTPQGSSQVAILVSGTQNGTAVTHQVLLNLTVQ